MDAVLLDTDVFSYLLRAGDQRGDPYRRHVENRRVAISFVTVAELLYGAEKRGWGAYRRAELEARFRVVVIVPFDMQICRAYARISNSRMADGSTRVIAANDRWIAACAINHRLPLVSNNRRHFEGIPDLTLITEAPPPHRPQDQPLPLAGGEPEEV